MARSRFFLLGCLGVAITASSAASTPVLGLLDPTPRFEREWRHHAFGRSTDYTFAVIDGRPAVRAVGRGSASGLYKDVSYSLKTHPWLEWSWRAERVQPSADLSTTSADDFAAGIMVLFGKPSFFGPKITTLNYVWTNEKHAADTVVPSPREPEFSRHVVIRGGAAPLGAWVMERRNVVEDFRRAFGRDPPDRVAVIGLFTDNDQTGEPVDVAYGAIRALSF